MDLLYVSYRKTQCMYYIILSVYINTDSHDYVSDQSFEVTLSDSMRNQNISVHINQDEISELEENFTISLEGISLIDSTTDQIIQLKFEEDRERLRFNIREVIVRIQDDDGILLIAIF